VIVIISIKYFFVNHSQVHKSINYIIECKISCVLIVLLYWV